MKTIHSFAEEIIKAKVMRLHRLHRRQLSPISQTYLLSRPARVLLLLREHLKDSRSGYGESAKVMLFPTRE